MKNHLKAPAVCTRFLQDTRLIEAVKGRGLQAIGLPLTGVDHTPTVTRKYVAADGLVLSTSRQYTARVHLHASLQSKTWSERDAVIVKRMVEKQFVLVLENTASSPRVSFWPKRQCGEEWRLRYGRPARVGRAICGREVDQKFSGRRKIAASLVDPSLQPLTMFKSVGAQVPANELHQPVNFGA